MLVYVQNHYNILDCSGKNLTCIRMIIRLELPRASPEIFTTLRIDPEVSVTSDLSETILYPEDISSPEPHSTAPKLFHSEVITFSGSSPLRDTRHSKGFNSEPEAQITDHP